jgi:elongation factor P
MAMPTEDNRFIFPMVPGPAPKTAPQSRSGPVAVQFVYKNGENFVMMTTDTYELLEVTKAQVGPAGQFLKEGLDGITIAFWEGFIVGLEIPATVELKVAGVIPHDDSGPDEKSFSATLETGAEVTVPVQVYEGAIVRIDTRTGAFAGMAGTSEI